MNKSKKENAAQEKFEDINIQSCSATECTGLIPTPARSEEERESYEDLFPYLPKASSADKRGER